MTSVKKFTNLQVDQIHVFVGSEFRRIPMRQISNLPATPNQAFGQTTSVDKPESMCIKGCSNPSLSLIRKIEVYLAQFNARQNRCFRTESCHPHSGVTDHQNHMNILIEAFELIHHDSRSSSRLSHDLG